MNVDIAALEVRVLLIESALNALLAAHPQRQIIVTELNRHKTEEAMAVLPEKAWSLLTMVNATLD